MVALIFGLAGLLLAAQLAGAARGPEPDPQVVLLQGTQVIGCGNGICEPRYEETCSTCPGDCGSCGACGNGTCEQGETCESCTSDCCPEQACNNPCDNDGVCEAPCEGSFNCGDCPSVCGDAICAPHEINNCCGPGSDCPVDVTCGDGICSACENNAVCPTDCEGVTTTEAPVTTAAPTTAVPTTAVVTRVVTTVRVTSTATDRPTSTDTATATDTDTPTATKTSTATATPEPEGCGLVPYETRPGDWQSAYGGAVGPEGFIPVQDEDLEVWVCPVPPSGERMCIPMYNGLLEEAGNDLTRIKLVDCPEGGECRIFDQVPEQEGDQLCYTVGVDDTNPICGVGCALAPLVDEPPPGLPWWWWIPLLALLLLLLLLLILFLPRRRRDRDEEADDEIAGLVTSSRGGGSATDNFAESPPRSLQQTKEHQYTPPPDVTRLEESGTLSRSLQDTKEHRFTGLDETRLEPPRESGDSGDGGGDDLST
jgi:hypothetical protein